MSMLSKLMEIRNFDNTTNEWEEKQKIASDYLGFALQIYFTKLGFNPFEEVEK